MIRRINRIAAHRGLSIPDYLLEKLGPVIDRDEEEMLADLMKERGESRPRSKR